MSSVFKKQPSEARSQHVLVADQDLRTTVLVSAALTLAIIFWLMRLRADALDITFERVFFGLFLFQDYALALCAFVVLVLSLLPVSRALGMRCARFLGAHPLSVAAGYSLILSVGAVIVYHAHPLSMDEYSPYFQSQIFAAGRLTGQFPVDLLDWLVPEPFHNYFLNVSYEDGRVVTSYWPGFALMLTPFTAAGVPWLCNPVLSGLGVLVIHRLALALLGKPEQAGLAVLLTVAAPAFAINGMSYYSMQAHLLCNAAFALCLLTPTPKRALLAGLIGSIALTLHNPVPHLLFALPWIAWMTADVERRRLLPALIAGYLPLCLALGLMWAWFSSSIATAGQLATGNQSFVVEVIEKLSAAFSLPGAGLLRARLIGLAKLLLWAVPAALVAAVFGFYRFRHHAKFQLLAWSAFLTFLGYLFVPFDQGHGWGFRYFHSVWFVVPLLASASTLKIDQAESSQSSALFGFAAACGVLSALLLVPLGSFQVERFIDKHLAYLPSSLDGETKVVIVSPGMGYYSIDLVQNDPFLREERITLITHGRKEDAQFVAARFPNLTLLSVDHRGSVWGIKKPSQLTSGTFAPDDHTEKK